MSNASCYWHKLEQLNQQGPKSYRILGNTISFWTAQKYRKEQKYCEILLQQFFFFFTLKCNLFMNFQHHSVSHDPSEIIILCWFGGSKNIFIIINVENL